MGKEGYSGRNELGSETLQYSKEYLGVLHNRVVVVTGVTASGKDTLIDRALSCMNEDERILKINPADDLSRVLSVNRDEIKRVPLERLVEAQDQLAEEHTAQVPCIITGHVVPYHQDVFMLNPRIFNTMNPMHYVVVTRDPKQVAYYRELENAEGKRNRLIESEDAISFNQDFLLHTIGMIARKQRADFTRLINTEGNMDANIKMLQDIFREVKGL